MRESTLLWVPAVRGSLDQSDPSSLMGTFNAVGIVTDGPQDISNGQRPEGGLGHCRDTGVGHILHGPDIQGEVVTDDGPLHPHIEDH